ncbi:hypothetical protein NPIL_39981 [Nephila pilipes]|uniref:Uncharacterized protein n=1 Tax=Nephila pilipes TaxID=299642 RepID=A0A8X6U3V2_NEPPI|nr:hypothetical protein NPIL_39981 [Nephila pilipes]
MSGNLIKSYFLVILCVCFVFLSIHPEVVEMAPKTRVERQSGDGDLITTEVSKDTVKSLLDASQGHGGSDEPAGNWSPY